MRHIDTSRRNIVHDGDVRIVIHSFLETKHLHRIVRYTAHPIGKFFVHTGSSVVEGIEDLRLEKILIRRFNDLIPTPG